jgi:serine protease Do
LDGMQTLFYCDPVDGSVAGIEMYPDDNVDPCEVYFSDYREENGRFLPHRMEVRYGNAKFGVFALANFDLQPTPEKKP